MRCHKSAERQHKIVFVNSVQQVTRECATSFLAADNLAKLVEAYYQPEDHPDIAQLVDLEEVKGNLFNLSILLHVITPKDQSEDGQDLQGAIEYWQQSRSALQQQTNKLFQSLKDLEY